MLTISRRTHAAKSCDSVLRWDAVGSTGEISEQTGTYHLGLRNVVYTRERRRLLSLSIMPDHNTFPDGKKPAKKHSGAPAFCSKCHALPPTGVRFRACARCKDPKGGLDEVAYCSKECQTSDWRMHKCVAFPNLVSTVTLTVLTTGRSAVGALPPFALLRNTSA